MKSSKKNIIVIIIALLIISIGCYGTYKYFENQKIQNASSKEESKTDDAQKPSSTEEKINVETSMKAEDDVNAVTVTMPLNKYDNLDETEKNKIYDNIASGVDGYSPVLTLDQGVITFDIKDKDSNEVVLKEKPTVEITAYPGLVSLPETSAMEATKHVSWKSTLEYRDGRYVYNLGEYFQAHPGEDHNACFIKVTYKINGETMVTFSSVIFTTMGSGK